MKVLHAAAPLSHPPAPVCLAIGFFDGVHLGHQAVIQRTLSAAKTARAQAVAVTFDRHPQSVVAPDRAPALLYPLSRRIQVLGALGLDACLVFPFDLEFSQQPPEAFVDRLLTGFQRVAGISVGTRFFFGHERRGDVTFLRQLGERHGFKVNGISSLEVDGEIVSSSRLRALVAAGDFTQASELLGRPYDLTGRVQSGDQLGRQLGFPTANLDVTGLVLPPSGVYAATAKVRMGQHAGRWPAAVNIGTRPTVDGSAVAMRVEAHLLEFDEDLYGEELSLEIGVRLRGEVRFPSRDALVEQIRSDVAKVREWAGNRGLL